MDYIGYVIIGLIVLLGVWITFGSRKKRWYKVYLANNDIMLLQRDIKERWWRTSDRYLRFVNEQGHEITFPSNAHWVLMWEEVPDSEIDIVRDEIRRTKESQRENKEA